MSQSNTRSGDIVVAAGEALTDKAGYLVKLTHESSVPEAKLPETIADLAIYVVTDGAADTENATLRPLSAERNVRLKLDGSCQPGDQLVLADTSVSEDQGKVRALPAVPGTYSVLALAEEAGADGQLVLARPYAVGNVTVS